MTRGRLVRTFWLGAAALLVAAALIAIVALFRGELTETDGRILGTLGALFLVGATGLAGLALADSERYAAFGWTVAALTPLELGVLASWIWVEPVGDTLQRAGLTTLLIVIGQLALVSHLLLLVGRRFLPLVALTAALLTSAVAGTITAVWAEPNATGWAKVLAVLWILAGLCWLLLPILQRFTAAGRLVEDRVLSELDGVELVATQSGADAIEVRLARGERLLLRRRD